MNTKEEIKNLIIKWRNNDYGSCACLGDCDKCGYHKCHGCLCPILNMIDEYTRAYANDRFEKAVVEKASTDESITVADKWHIHGWDDCRSEIIKRWNEQK